MDSYGLSKVLNEQTARAFQRQCLQTDGLGYQVFNAGNDTNVATITSAELIEQFFPGVPVTRELETYEALFSNRKIREMLGFVEEHNWRQYVNV